MALSGMGGLAGIGGVSARERAPGRRLSGEAEAERPLRGDKAECTRLAEVRGYLI